MANSLYGNVWYVDTLGIITKSPIWLRGVMFYPYDKADILQMNWWDEANPSTTITIVGTVHTTSHIDSDGAFADATAFADGNVFKIHHYTGADKLTNETYHLMGAQNDDTLTVVATSLTADAECTMSITPYPARVAVKMVQPLDSNIQSLWVPFDGERGQRFPNLTLETLTDNQGTVGAAILYLG